MGEGAAAGRGFQVRVAQLQNDAARGDALEAKRTFKAVGEAIELLAENHEVGLGARKGGLLGEASGVALPTHPAVALAAREGVELKATAMAERFREDRRVDRSELAHVTHAELGQTLLGVTADARKPCHRKGIEELGFRAEPDLERTRPCKLGGEAREKLVGTDSRAQGKPQLRSDGASQRLGEDLCRLLELGDIEVGAA